MDFFQKGGGDPSQSKSFGTLFVHQTEGGMDQIQKFLGTFYPDFGDPKVPNKISLRKSVQKLPKVWIHFKESVTDSSISWHHKELGDVSLAYEGCQDFQGHRVILSTLIILPNF